jgi:hypothetical protein
LRLVYLTYIPLSLHSFNLTILGLVSLLLGDL